MLYLTTDYDRLNPVTKEKAIADFKEYFAQNIFYLIFYEPIICASLHPELVNVQVY